jgi:hypothetical protein
MTDQLTLDVEVVDPPPRDDEGRALGPADDAEGLPHPISNEIEFTATEPVCTWRAPQDYVSQFRRRYEAARRLPPQPHSGRRDPEGMGWWRR